MLIIWELFGFVLGPGDQTQASHMLGKHFNIEVHLQPFCFYLFAT